MELRLESARLLTWKAAMLRDAGKPFTKVFVISVLLSHLSHYRLEYN